MLNPVALSVNFGNGFGHGNVYNPNVHDSIQFSKVDVSFAERIVPLLDGAAFYKKFSSR